MIDTTSNPVCAELAASLDLARKLTIVTLETAPADRWHVIPPGFRANIAWLVGHLSYAPNNAVLNFGLGVDFVVPEDWVELYGPAHRGGVGPQNDINAYPPNDELIEAYHRSIDAVIEQIGQLTDTELAGDLRGPAPEKLPFYYQNIGDGIRFIIQHDAYHRGQIGWITKALEA